MWLYTSQLATTIMWLSCQSFTDWRFPNIMTLASYFPAPSMQWCSDALLRFGKSFGENKLTATFWLRHKNSLCGSPSCHRCFPFRYRGSPCGAAFCWRTKMSLFFLEQIMVNWIVDRKFKKKKKKNNFVLAAVNCNMTDAVARSLRWLRSHRPYFPVSWRWRLLHSSRRAGQRWYIWYIKHGGYGIH